MTTQTDYKVTLRHEGSAGWIEYSEGSRTLLFPWERMDTGISIETPMLTDWLEFCDRQNCEWAVNRRELITNRIADWGQKQYTGGNVEVADRFIHVVSATTWLDYFRKNKTDTSI